MLLRQRVRQVQSVETESLTTKGPIAILGECLAGFGDRLRRQPLVAQQVC
jgi:hypothetical protein